MHKIEKAKGSLSRRHQSCRAVTFLQTRSSPSHPERRGRRERKTEGREREREKQKERVCSKNASVFYAILTRIRWMGVPKKCWCLEISMRGLTFVPPCIMMWRQNWAFGTWENAPAAPYLSNQRSTFPEPFVRPNFVVIPRVFTNLLFFEWPRVLLQNLFLQVTNGSGKFDRWFD